MKAYVSGDSLIRETLIAESDNLDAVGQLEFISYYEGYVDNIKVYCDPDDEYVAKHKVYNLTPDGKAEFEFTKTGNKKLTYESADPEIAEVDADGNIYAVHVGYTTVKALDEKKNEIENVGVYVYPALKSGAFEDSFRNTLYVGDTVGMNYKRTPSDATVDLEWSVDDNSLLSFYGGTPYRRAVTALAPGKATVTATDKLSGIETKMEFDILPEREKDKSEYTAFYYTGENHKVSKHIAGFHHYARNNDEDMWKLVNDLSPGSFRPEHSTVNKREVTKDDFNETEFWETYPVWDWANKTSADELIFCVRENFSPDEAMYWIKKIHSMLDPGKQLVIECGNEIYAMQFEAEMPTVKDYIEWAVELSKKVKEYDPDIKVIVCGEDVGGETNILSDPNNTSFMLEDNWAYTQGTRIYEWNSTIKDNMEYFDGVTSHDYMSTEWGANISEEEFIRMGYAWDESYVKNVTNMYARYKKPIYHTEFGNLASDMFWAGGMTDADKVRYQWQMYPYAAMRNFEQMLCMLETGAVVSASYHCLQDGQGFGIFDNKEVASETDKFPNYYIMQEMGKLLDECNTYYDLNAPDDNYYVMQRPWYHGKDRNVMVNNVDAWALGDENGVKKFIVSNHTNARQTVSLKGTSIVPIWEYGGDPTTIMKGWMKNEGASSYVYRRGEYDISYIPKAVQNGKSGSEYEIAPYTIMVFDVDGSPEQLENSTVGKISAYAEKVLENSLALKVGSSRAIRDNIEVAIDEDASVVPVVKNERTLLPLRFVSESFGCDVEYDEATKGITVNGDGINIRLTVGKSEYTVNGEKKEFDVPAEIENDRTLVPLRALAEALGKEVFWDERGIIMIYPPKVGFESDQEWYDETLKPDIDSVVAYFE